MKETEKDNIIEVLSDEMVDLVEEYSECETNMNEGFGDYETEKTRKYEIISRLKGIIHQSAFLAEHYTKYDIDEYKKDWDINE